MSSRPLTIPCRVCVEGSAEAFRVLRGLRYLRCRRCEAVFLAEAQLPDAETERARYLLHENDPDDAGYRAFLRRLADPLLERIGPAREVLDYGCGPGPALARMMEEAGHRVRLYDPFFHADASALERTWDVIACTETVEHFHRPADEFARLDRLLRPGGCLGIMTSFLVEPDRFDAWHYRRDPTHVTFYNEHTFRVLASRFRWNCEFPAKNVVLMLKPTAW